MIEKHELDNINGLQEPRERSTSRDEASGAAKCAGSPARAKEAVNMGFETGSAGIASVKLANGRKANGARSSNVARDVLLVAWPVMLSYVAVGLPCGVLAAKAGMTPLMAGILSATYLSGGGQFMISNLWMSGTPIPSLLASVAAISTRFALYSASLAPHLKRFGKRESFAVTCCFSEEAYGISLSKLAEGPSWTARHALTLNLTLLATWTVSVVAGAFIGSAVDIPTALASFAMTSLFIYLLWSQPHTASNAFAAAAAALAIVVCKWNGLSGPAVPLAALTGVVSGLVSQMVLESRRKPAKPNDSLNGE